MTYATKTFNASRLNIDLMKIYEDVGSQAKIEQSKYDLETNHSINREQQIKWNKKIENELQSLEAYANVIVPLKVNWKK